MPAAVKHGDNGGAGERGEDVSCTLATLHGVMSWRWSNLGGMGLQTHVRSTMADRAAWRRS